MTEIKDLSGDVLKYIADILDQPPDLGSFMNTCKQFNTDGKDACTTLQDQYTWSIPDTFKMIKKDVVFGYIYMQRPPRDSDEDEDEEPENWDGFIYPKNEMHVGICIKLNKAIFKDNDEEHHYLFIAMNDDAIIITKTPPFFINLPATIYKFMISLVGKRLDNVLINKDILESDKVYKPVGLDHHHKMHAQNQQWLMSPAYNVVVSRDQYEAAIRNALDIINGTKVNAGGSRISNAVYVKISRKYKGKDGIERVMYQKGKSMYVKKKSADTGKMVYTKVKI
jgi:hypothetical protein